MTYHERRGIVVGDVSNVSLPSYDSITAQKPSLIEISLYCLELGHEGFVQRIISMFDTPAMPVHQDTSIDLHIGLSAALVVLPR